MCKRGGSRQPGRHADATVSSVPLSRFSAPILTIACERRSDLHAIVTKISPEFFGPVHILAHDRTKTGKRSLTPPDLPDRHNHHVDAPLHDVRHPENQESLSVFLSSFSLVRFLKIFHPGVVPDNARCANPGRPPPPRASPKRQPSLPACHPPVPYR